MTYGMRNVQIGVSLPPETLKALDDYTAEFHYSRSQGARVLLESALELVAHDAADVQAELARSAA